MSPTDPATTSRHAMIIQLLRFRSDESRIETAEVVEYMERIRVAASVVDGMHLGHPHSIFVTVLVDGDECVIRADGVVRESLPFEAATRSILHHFNTAAVFDDAVVDQHGQVHDHNDLPAELQELVDSELGELDSPAVHIMKTRDPMQSQFIAAAAERPVQSVRLGEFTIVKDASGRSHAASLEIVTKSELPSATLTQFAGGATVSAKIKNGMRTTKFSIRDHQAFETLAATFDNAEIEILLAAPDRLVVESGPELPPELSQALLAVSSDGDAFLAEVLEILKFPQSAVAWFYGTEPDSLIDTIEPQSIGAILKNSLKGGFDDKTLEAQPVFGFMRHILRSRPVLAFLYGIAEIVLALTVLILGGSFLSWAFVRWVFGVLCLLDGVMNSLWAISLLRNRSKNSHSAKPDDS